MVDFFRPFYQMKLLLINRKDPKYEEEVSGCTASVGIISQTKIYVVRYRNSSAMVDWKNHIILIDYSGQRW